MFSLPIRVAGGERELGFFKSRIKMSTWIVPISAMCAILILVRFFELRIYHVTGRSAKLAGVVRVAVALSSAIVVRGTGSLSNLPLEWLMVVAGGAWAFFSLVAQTISGKRTSNAPHQ